MGDATTLSRFRVEGMDCASCAAKITTAVRRVPGVGDVKVSVSAGTMTVDYVGGADDAAVVRQVNGLGGYRASPLRGKAPGPARPAGDGGDHDHDHGDQAASEGHDHADAAIGSEAQARPSEVEDEPALARSPCWKAGGVAAAFGSLIS